MWTAQRPVSTRSERTGSIHSVASLYGGRPESVASNQSFSQLRGYDSDQSSENAFADDQMVSSRPVSKVVIPAIWQPRPKEPKLAPPAEQPAIEAWRAGQTDEPVVRLVPQALNSTPKNDWNARGGEADNDTESLASTLDGEDDMPEYPEKTPTSIPRMQYANDTNEANDEPMSPAPAPHKPGPLESQLAALMSKLVYIERSNPVAAVEPAEYEEMAARLKKLEADHAQLWKRHTAIWTLRDEDLENNIKIRGLLAKKDRDLIAMTALRDEDLVNVQVVRNRLADKTREVERLQSQTGRSSPTRGRPTSFIERRATNDLFAQAKSAALEQRVLELEKRNSDLITQVESLKGGASIDDLNRMTAHQAWKDHVADLEVQLKAKDAELAKRSNGSASAPAPSASEWSRIESIVQEHGAYRESVGGKLQALRSEKEALQRQLHAKEDECHTLELSVQSLRRRIMPA